MVGRQISQLFAKSKPLTKNSWKFQVKLAGDFLIENESRRDIIYWFFFLGGGIRETLLTQY